MNNDQINDFLENYKNDKAYPDALIESLSEFIGSDEENQLSNTLLIIHQTLMAGNWSELEILGIFEYARNDWDKFIEYMEQNPDDE